MRPLYYDLPKNLDADKRAFAQIEDDVYPDQINENSYPFFPLRKYLDCIKSNSDLVLEAGCGPGRVLKYLKYKGVETVGIDIDFDSLKKVNPKAHKGRRIPVINCDVTNLPFKKAVFKIITLFGVIGLLKNREKQKELIKNLKDYLRKDGLMIISFTRQNGIYYYIHSLMMNNFLRKIFLKAKKEKYFGLWCYKEKEAIGLIKDCQLKIVGLYSVMKKSSLYEFFFLRKNAEKIYNRRGDESLQLNFLGEFVFRLLNNKYTESLISSAFVIICSAKSTDPSI